ncbi:MAG TPA: hypothetical protein DDY78_21455 [Planctomycetales bacterium]|nr:hypothetical protein [Planctomycetales bacterium]
MTDAERLSEAAWTGDLTIIKDLIAAGVDINAPSAEGRWPPLHLAIENQRIDVIRWLLVAGADVNRNMSGGWTPLVHAIDIESDAAVQAGTLSEEMPIVLVALLLSAGAIPTTEALEIARRYQNYRVLELLQQYTSRG